MDQDLTSTLHPLMWGVIEELPEESLEKALSDGYDPAWLMKGHASAEVLDADKQILVQSGMNWDEYDARGIVHYKHPYSAERICGQGIKRTPTLFKGYPANHIEVQLLRDLPVARHVREQHLALCKGPRKMGLGFSVEGRIDEMRGNRITKCTVRTMAIDGAPRNPVSFAMPLAAALGGAMGYQSFPPELAKAAMRLAYDPDVQERLALTEGVDKNDLKALRLLKRNPNRTLLAALERVAGM